MSLLCVTIKRAQLQGADEEFHTYIVVKLMNVKSTTIAVRGANPSWEEQEFIFETNRLDQGLILELTRWGRGAGRWVQVDQEIETRNGQTVGTCKPTDHSLLVDVRFELPFEVQQSADAEEVQARLQSLNRFIEESADQQHVQRVPFNHSGVSEDSDYTSDLSFPIHQQQQQANHQWNGQLRHAHAPESAPNHSGGVDFGQPVEDGRLLSPAFTSYGDVFHPTALVYDDSHEYPQETYGNFEEAAAPFDESPHGLRRLYDPTLLDQQLADGPDGTYNAFNMQRPDFERDHEPSTSAYDPHEAAYHPSSSMERGNSGDGYAATGDSCDDSPYRPHADDREQTPDYGQGRGSSGADYRAEGRRGGRGRYEDRYQDERAGGSGINYVSPPVYSDEYDVEMDEFGGSANGRELTPQPAVITSPSNVAFKRTPRNSQRPAGGTTATRRTRERTFSEGEAIVESNGAWTGDVYDEQPQDANQQEDPLSYNSRPFADRRSLTNDHSRSPHQPNGTLPNGYAHGALQHEHNSTHYNDALALQSAYDEREEVEEEPEHFAPERVVYDQDTTVEARAEPVELAPSEQTQDAPNGPTRRDYRPALAERVPSGLHAVRHPGRKR
ncbi:C2 domain-containing protein [Aphelenchoides fujianensis]|nr:C2 domain-containing protein [Aphelenchoides fujianensis]